MPIISMLLLIHLTPKKLQKQNVLGNGEQTVPNKNGKIKCARNRKTGLKTAVDVHRFLANQSAAIWMDKGTGTDTTRKDLGLRAHKKMFHFRRQRKSQPSSVYQLN